MRLLFGNKSLWFGFFSFESGSLDKGILPGSKEVRSLLCETLGRRVACHPTSQEVIIGAAQGFFFVFFFNQSGGVIFSGSVRTHTHIFTNPICFPAAGPGRPT